MKYLLLLSLFFSPTTQQVNHDWVILLDFNGHETYKGSGLTLQKRLNILHEVQKAFKPFNVFITTREDVKYRYGRQRVVITEDNLLPGTGGYSTIGSLINSRYGWDQLSFVFSKTLEYKEPKLVYTIVHEIGHTIGLQHQATWSPGCGRLIAEHSTGDSTSAPWMGFVATGKKGYWAVGHTIANCTYVQSDSLFITLNLK